MIDSIFLNYKNFDILSANIFTIVKFLSKL